MPNEFNTMHLPHGGCIDHRCDTRSDLCNSKSMKFQDESDADALALWAMTYVMEHFEVTNAVCDIARAYVWQVDSDETAKVFCHRAEMVSKITPTAVHRLIERGQPTSMKHIIFLAGITN